MVLEETSSYVNDNIMKQIAKLYSYVIGDDKGPVGKVHVSCMEDCVFVHASMFVVDKASLHIAREDCKKLYQELVKDKLKYNDNQIWCYTPKPRLANFLLGGRMSKFLVDDKSGYTLMWGHTRSVE